MVQATPTQTSSRALQYCEEKYRRKYLPHINARLLTQFITFRLNDSIPVIYNSSIKNINETKRRQIFVEEISDSCYGHCYLNLPHVASIVKKTLYYFNQERYQLHA